MTNINKTPSHKAHLSKNGFDMSMIRKFSSACGMLLPVYWDWLNPGEKVKFSAEMFTRTPNLLSPAMVKFTNHCDWFFVPANQLNTNFGNLFFGIQDLPSSLYNLNNVLKNYPTIKIDTLINSSYPNVSNGDLDVMGVGRIADRIRLMDLLDYGSNVDSTFHDIRVNPMLLQAYQKIFFDVYRLTDRQSNNPDYYNTDKNYDGTEFTSAQAQNFTTLWYRAWKRDLFTNLQPAPLINGSDVGMLSSADLSSVNQWLNSAAPISTYLTAKPQIVSDKSVSGNQVASSAGSAAYIGHVSQALSSVVSTSNLRSMFAIEKLSEITRRSAKHYDAQVLAHFGYDVPTGISGEVYRLGSDSCVFNIGDVVSTADTFDESTDTGAGLGKMAGQAASYGQGKPKSFVAPCHGILMAIYSCVPEADYRDTGLDRFNSYSSREDFYQPEFDRLGMQPQFYYERRFTGSSTDNAAILGWQYRYANHKCKANKINGKFNHQLVSWTTCRPDANDGTIKNFLISPAYLNSILPYNFNMGITSYAGGQNEPDYQLLTSRSDIYETDYLYNMFQFHVFKSSTMSTYGLPNL